MTTEQLKNRIANNVVYVQQHVSGDRYRGTNALFVAKGYLLIPYHFMRNCPKETIFHIHRGNGRIEMPKVDFGEYKGKKQWVRVGTDMVMIRLTGVNYARDIRDLFATHYSKQTFARAIQLFIQNGEKKTNVLTGLYAKRVDYEYDNNDYVGIGHVGRSECAPVNGMCMSPVIVDIRQPEIIGVHIAGQERNKNTFVLSVLKGELDKAVSELDAVCIFQDINQTEAYEGQAEKCTSTEVHKFCATRYADPTLPLDVIGTVPGSGPRVMNTRKTPYHDQVKSFLGIEDTYGIPKSSARIVDGELMSPWKNCIEELNQAKNLIPYTALERAREEIVEEFTKPLEQYLKAGGIGRPLTVDEAINGIPGIRGIDGQKMSTSAGLKYGGTKKKHLEKDEHPYEYKQEIYDDVQDLRKKLASRTRGINALNSNLKDEPLKKKKVDEYRTRVFFSDELDTLIVCGQEFSPILAYLMNHPQSSHCAVGLNAQSFDWECVAKYLTRDGTVDPEDGICLDFKAFDKTLPENLMKMSWQVFLDIAKKMPGYTQEDIDIMTTMIDEKTTPFMHFNGTLMQLNFDHTSGNLCTAAAGSIAGLMLLLIAFYAIEDPDGKKGMKGLDYIRSIHLGDDLASTLKDKESLDYNFLTVQAKLKEYGITITMPDKEAEPTPFQNVFKEDFLKRIFSHCPLRNAIVGQLDRKSLYKSLLYYLPSKVETRENQLGQSLSAVLGELSLYSRNEFNDFKKFVVELAYHYQLNVPNLWMEYDDYVIRWAVDSGKRHKEYQEREKPYLAGLIPSMSNSQQLAIFGKVIEEKLEAIPEEETFIANSGDIEPVIVGHDLTVEIECCNASSCCPWFRRKPLVKARVKVPITSLESGGHDEANTPSSVENDGLSERPTDQDKTPSEDKGDAEASSD
uniref:RNA-dependent RNA polymerase n=1 Tax=Perinereis aibuhitensis marna-like virus 2 TaxID=3237975 RepID=A0AB39A373_9VIRU